LSLFVDTSVWSLAFRHDAPPVASEREELARAIRAGEELMTTGLVLQELLQGFSGPRNRAQILDRFAALPLLVPDRRDHVEAAELRNKCRRGGIQAGTIDALLAQLCVRHDLTMLTSDNDFRNIARHCALRLWSAPT
jgi:predicted nucleic acid-binding protein